MSQDSRSTDEQMATRMQRLVEQWSQARVSLKQIVGLSEEELFTIATQGYNLFLQGRTDDARIVFEGLLAIDPRNAYYYRALGAIYWRLQQAELAIRQFGYAIRVAPREMSSYINRAEVYVATDRHALARQDLYRALDLATPSDGPLTRKAQAILQMI